MKIGSNLVGRAAVVLVAAFFASVLINTVSAHAGTYTVHSCLRPATSPSPMWDSYKASLVVPDKWKDELRVTPSETTGVGVLGDAGDEGSATVIDNCGSEVTENNAKRPGSTVVEIERGPKYVYSSTNSGISFSAPVGTSLAGFEIARKLWLPSNDNYFAITYSTVHLGAPVPNEVIRACDPADYGCYGSEFGQQKRFTVMTAVDGLPPGQTNQVSILLGCSFALEWGAQTTCQPNEGSVASMEIPSMKFVLHDLIEPSVSNVGGSLATEINTPLKGVKTLSFRAGDDQSGVYRAVVEYDGTRVLEQVLDSNGGQCADAGVDPADDYEFDRSVPCAKSAVANVALDTDQLREGTHQMAAYVEDAAGNRAAVLPLQDVLVSRGISGRSCEPCNGTGGDPNSGRVILTGRGGKQRVRNGQQIVLQGKLVDAAGAPIAGAQIDALERIHLPRRALTQIRTLTTDQQGMFNFAPVTTSSRTVRFAFSARRGSTAYVSTADAELVVSSAITLKAKRRAISAFGSMKLSGQLKAAPLDRGVPIEVQARDGRRWRTIAVKRTDETGKVVFRYRFRRVTSGKFQFRFVAAESSDLPIEPTASRPVTIAVGQR